LIAGAAAPHHGHPLNPEGEGEGDGDQGAATTETAPPKKAHGRGGECTLSEHRTAVVIEDDVDVRNLLSAILKGAGFACFPETTGLEGIDAVRAHQADTHHPGHQPARHRRASRSPAGFAGSPTPT
jgi:hypothetical protein